QMIHYKIIHRAYLYPRRLHQMKIKDNPYCDFCAGKTIGTFLHMVWECPEVKHFWENVSRTLSKIIGVTIPCTQRLILLNDSSKLDNQQPACITSRPHSSKLYNKMASSTQKEIDLTVDSMISGDFGSFQIKEIKGEGVCGLVARCIDLSTNKDVAVKISKSHLSVTRHEAKLLRDLRHVSKDKNIVEFITSFMYQGHYCLVMEHLDQSLFDLMISRRCKPLHISHICYITEQLLVTFKELAKRKLIHGDLKPDNIMLVNHKLEPFKIKLIDFGLSTTVRSVLPGYVFQPIGYRAPEVTLGATFNQAIDMWGLGCVLAFLYMSQNLFPIDCEYEMMRIITQIKGMPHVQQLKEGLFTNLIPFQLLEAEKKKTMQFFDLLNQLLHVNPAKRITPEKSKLLTFPDLVKYYTVIILFKAFNKLLPSNVQKFFFFLLKRELTI
uniref:Protein kinase domain-containing protein n=1 Tax=Periophthalmus magnuspinnatus TaxID=409849 RepID=A0A3B4A4Q2_9GOBI